MAEKECKNILVRGVNWIGDAVMTMPALRDIRRSIPDSKITLLVKPWVAPLFEKDPSLDEIILYSEEYKGLTGRLKLAQRLREHAFCKAVLFQNAFDAAIIAFMAGIPERIGYDRDARGLLLTQAIPFSRDARDLHHIEYYRNLIEKAGFVSGDSLPWIHLTIDERLQARERLRGLARPLVGINPGATYGSSKRWHAGRFAEVARRVVEEINGGVVIFGGPSEVGIGEEILESAGFVRDGSLVDSGHPLLSNNVLSVAGKTTLRELIALISECDLLLTNDSGPMHISYAVGTPIVSIFGSTSPELTGPPMGDLVIRKRLDCAPCFDRSCRKGHLRCMDLVTAEEVVEAVKKLVPSRKAVFFDRDGTLCRDAHYLSRMEDFELFPEIASLERLKATGHLLIGITNQSGIARGLVREDFVRRVNAIFMEHHGFDGFFFCPHHPDEHCSCRKPQPGLLLQARREFGIDLKKSYVVGDKESDMLLARTVGARSIHVGTGQEDVSLHADFRARDLREVVQIVESTT